MPVKLAITGCAPVEFDADTITLGSDPSCSIALPAAPDVKPNHAVIRQIDGLWLMEVREAESFSVGGSEPKKAHLLSSGDVIRLTENGLAVTIELAPAKPKDLAPKAPKKPSDVILLPDDDDDEDIPMLVGAPKPAPVKKPPSSAIIQVPKQQPSSSVPPLSSSSLPKPPKAPSSTTIPAVPTASSPSIKTSKAPLSTTINTTKAPSSTTIKTTKAPSSTTIPTRPSGKSGGSDSSIPPKSPKRPASSASHPTIDSDEPSPNVPILKRLSSYEVPVASVSEEDVSEGWEELPGRRRRGNDADVRWIKMIIFRCVAAGAVVLLLLITIREIWKAMNRQPDTASRKAVIRAVVSSDADRTSLSRFDAVG